MESVKTVVKEAYADCWLPWEAGSKRRNLDFQADETVSPKEARAIMEEAVPDGYNEFTADLLSLFPDSCRIRLARELSVCIYIYDMARQNIADTANLPSQSELCADEYSQVGDAIRIWWD